MHFTRCVRLAHTPAGIPVLTHSNSIGYHASNCHFSAYRRPQASMRVASQSQAHPLPEHPHRHRLRSTALTDLSSPPPLHRQTFPWGGNHGGAAGGWARTGLSPFPCCGALCHLNRQIPPGRHPLPRPPSPAPGTPFSKRSLSSARFLSLPTRYSSPGLLTLLPHDCSTFLPRVHHFVRPLPFPLDMLKPFLRLSPLASSSFPPPSLPPSRSFPVHPPCAHGCVATPSSTFAPPPVSLKSPPISLSHPKGQGRSRCNSVPVAPPAPFPRLVPRARRTLPCPAPACRLARSPAHFTCSSDFDLSLIAMATKDNRLVLALRPQNRERPSPSVESPASITSRFDGPSLPSLRRGSLGGIRLCPAWTAIPD
jgi:hypothetical protein